MPVMLSPDAFDAWLDPEAEVETAKGLLAPYPEGALTAYPISTRVNAVRNDDPSILEPLDAAGVGDGGQGSGSGAGGGAKGGSGEGGTGGPTGGGDRQQSLF
ncbi:MAG: SOS response-associated peptidase family protein [Rhodovibrio sp.]|nr:SOS response-associated peptidase family protein [Rhodovibrio sp.]